MNDTFVKKGTAGTGGIYWWHRILLPTGYTEGQCYHGPDGGNWPTTRFGMPQDLTGKLVLDVGAWDGFFSFEAEKRGALRILATDCAYEEGGTWAGTKGFEYAHKELNSKVKWKKLNIETDITINTFDLVMCYGVLYHVKSPLKVLEHLCQCTVKNGICLIETAICKDNKAILEYRPYHEGDPTNYFYPSESWIEKAAIQVGFTKCHKIYGDSNRATFRLEK